MITNRNLRIFFLILGLLALSPLDTVADEQTNASREGTAAAGAVIERVTPGSTGERAGLQPGDLILSWSCAVSLPAFPRPASGSVRSPYDLLPLEIEEAPRRGVTLHGERGGQRMVWTLAAGGWDIEARPNLPAELAARSLEATAKIEKGDVTGAEPLWRAEAQSAQATGDGRLAAWFLDRLARALSEAGAWKEADTAFGEALAALERESDHPAAAQLLRAWGNTFEQRAAWDAAIERFQKALEIDRKTAPESLAAARTLDDLGVTLAKKGNYPAAEALLQQALALREKLAPGTSEVIWSLNNLGILTHRRGDLTRAEAYLRRGEELQRRLAPDNADHARLFQNLGNVYRNRGDLKKAEGFYRQALAMFEKATPNGNGVADCLDSLANVAIQRGDLTAADDFLRRSLAVQERRAPDQMDASTALIVLGNIASRRGDLEAAESHYRRALTIQEKLSPAGLETSYSLGSLGTVAFLQGDIAMARTYLYRALAIKEKLAPGSLDVAASLENLGRLETNSGNLAAAEEILRRALAIYQNEAPESLEVAEALRDLGEVATHRGRFPEALALHRQAWELQHRLAPESTGEAEALYFLGRAEVGAGRLEDGTRDLCRAIDVLDRQRGRIGGTQEARTSFEATLGDYYQSCLEGLIGLGRPAEAFHVLERGRARSFLALLAERDLRLSSLSHELDTERRRINAEYDRVQSQLARLSPGRDEKDVERLTDTLRDLRTRQGEISARIRRESPRSAALEEPEPLELMEVRRVLDPGTLLLAYAVRPEKTWLFVVEPADAAGPGLSVFPVPASTKVLRDEVESFRRLLTRSDSERTALEARARRLYDLLVQPAGAQIRRARRVLVSPDGPLHTLPFAALLHQDRYLIEWKPIHSVLSATVYAELARSRPAPRKPGEERVVAFGDPLYPFAASHAHADTEVRDALRRGLSLQPLPFSREEIEAIATLYPQARTYLGREATEERAKDLGPESRLLHFACHGLLDERFPLNSALALTIPENPGEGQDNGLLQAWEIFESVRLDADLVTLSACDSALGQEMGGEGLLGLTRAFQYAGARSVLGSLWSINDRSTGDLMKHFYRHLRDGKTKDEALQAAQAELIRTPHFSHPYHWAAFQLTGDWK